MSDPIANAIAENLGISVEAFLEEVQRFADDPTAEPELWVVDAETAAAEGVELPTAEEVHGFMERVDAELSDVGDRFQVAPPPRPTVTLHPPSVDTDPELEAHAMALRVAERLRS